MPRIKAPKRAIKRYSKAQIPNVALPGEAGTARVIAGELNGNKGPAKTFSPINLWDVSLRAGKSAELPTPDGHTTAVLVLNGKVAIDGGREAGEGDLAIFERSGTGISLKASTDAQLLVMDGEPLNEPIVGQGPFVMNTREEIQKTFEDFQQGHMGELN